MKYFHVLYVDLGGMDSETLMGLDEHVKFFSSEIDARRCLSEVNFGIADFLAAWLVVSVGELWPVCSRKRHCLQRGTSFTQCSGYACVEGIQPWVARRPRRQTDVGAANGCHVSGDQMSM